MARRVSTKTGASAPSKGFKIATGKGRGGAAAGPGSRKPAQKPQVVAFNESTVQAINDAGPKGHEVAHINPREGSLLEALGGSGEKDPETNIKSYEVVGDKKGKNSPKVAKKYNLKGLPKKGEGRVDDTHRVILATDKETKALNALKTFDKERGYEGGHGPEINRLAEMDFAPLEHVKYRGEVIPNLNSLDTDEEGTVSSSSDGNYSNEGEKDSSGEWNTSDNVGDWWDTPAGKKEQARLDKIKADKLAAKLAAEKLADEKAAAELAMKKKIAAAELAGKITKEEKRIALKNIERNRPLGTTNEEGKVWTGYGKGWKDPDSNEAALASGVELGNIKGDKVWAGVENGGWVSKDSNEAAIASGVELGNKKGDQVWAGVENGGWVNKDSSEAAAASGAEIGNIGVGGNSGKIWAGMANGGWVDHESDAGKEATSSTETKIGATLPGSGGKVWAGIENGGWVEKDSKEGVNADAIASGTEVGTENESGEVWNGSTWEDPAPIIDGIVDDAEANVIVDEFEDAEDRENILEGSDDGQGDLYEDLDGMLEEPTESNDRGDHGTVGADGTVYYDTTGEEGKNYFTALDQYYSGDAWDDPDYTGPLEDDINDTSSGEGDSLGGDSGDDAGTGDGTISGYNPDLDNETLGGDSHDNDPLDEPLGGDAGDGGISIDEPLDDALDENLGGDAGDDTTSIDDTDDDLGNDSEPGGYDPDADNDILGPDNSADGGGSTIDETDDDPTNDLYPEFPQSNDDPNPDVTTDLTEDEEVYDPTTALGKLQAQYKKYGETDYEKLYHDEFSDDLAEDYGAATKGLDFNFLTSGDRSEFNTAGDTVNDQQNYLGELLEGDQQDDLNTQARNYASNPNAAINKWYKEQQALIEGGATEFEELDLSEWADPSENYNPEFFGDEGDEGEILYDKRYYDPDETYYDASLATPTFQSMGTDDPEPIVEPTPGTPGGDEMILPETISDTGVIGPATDGLPPGTTIAPGMFDTLEEAPIEMGEDGLPPGTTILPGMPEPLNAADPEGAGFEGLDDSAFDMGDPNAWMNETEDEPIDTKVSTKLDENGLDMYGNKPKRRRKGLL